MNEWNDLLGSCDAMQMLRSGVMRDPKSGLRTSPRVPSDMRKARPDLDSSLPMSDSGLNTTLTTSKRPTRLLALNGGSQANAEVSPSEQHTCYMHSISILCKGGMARKGKHRNGLSAPVRHSSQEPYGWALMHNEVSFTADGIE